MGTEFTTVITAIDNSGHVVMKVSGLGKFDLETFEKLFREHILDISYICTDANSVYTEYSHKYSIQHYVRPSEYIDNLKLCNDEKDKEELYKQYKLDYTANNLKHYYSYAQIEELKKKQGLTLSAVNGLHNEIKGLVNIKHRGVSSKYFDGYIAFKALLKNYRADHNGVTPSTRKDAEEILCLILKQKENPLIKELKEISIKDLPKPNKTYLKKLKENTGIARQKAGRKKFIFTSEDISDSFAITNLLNEMPTYLLKELAKKCKIKGYTKIDQFHKYKYIQELKQLPNIKELILETLGNHGITIEKEKSL